MYFKPKPDKPHVIVCLFTQDGILKSIPKRYRKGLALKVLNSQTVTCIIICFELKEIVSVVV